MTPSPATNFLPVLVAAEPPGIHAKDGLVAAEGDVMQEDSELELSQNDFVRLPKLAFSCKEGVGLVNKTFHSSLLVAGVDPSKINVKTSMEP